MLYVAAIKIKHCSFEKRQFHQNRKPSIVERYSTTWCICQVAHNWRSTCLQWKMCRNMSWYLVSAFLEMTSDNGHLTCHSQCSQISYKTADIPVSKQYERMFENLKQNAFYSWQFKKKSLDYWPNLRPSSHKHLPPCCPPLRTKLINNVSVSCVSKWFDSSKIVNYLVF